MVSIHSIIGKFNIGKIQYVWGIIFLFDIGNIPMHAHSVWGVFIYICTIEITSASFAGIIPSLLNTSSIQIYHVEELWSQNIIKVILFNQQIQVERQISRGLLPLRGCPSASGRSPIPRNMCALSIETKHGVVIGGILVNEMRECSESVKISICTY